MDKAKHVFEKKAILGPFLDVNSLGIFSGIGYHLGKKHGNVERTIKPKRKYKTPVGPLAFAFLPGAIGYHFGYKKGFNKT